MVEQNIWQPTIHACGKGAGRNPDPCSNLDIFKKLCENLNRSMWDDIAWSDKKCWIWRGGFRGRYPNVSFGGREWPAHRVSAALFLPGVSLLTEDEICHKCDDTRCINPCHLFAGTHSDNMKDAYLKGRRSSVPFLPKPS